VEIARRGNVVGMTERRPGEDVAQQIEHDADELEDRLDRLEDHISDAQKAASARREESDPEAAAGDWEETRGAPGQGEDPEGAVGEHGARGKGATQDDATAEDEDATRDDATAEDERATHDDTDSSDSAASSGGDAEASAPQRDDPVGSRMPGHASGGDD
jgi:hypothetical protein